MTKRYNHRNKNPKTVVGTRTCFVCKTIAPRAQMLRFVGRPGQTVRFDAKENLPGRGMWLHANCDCLKKAIEKRIFFKAAKGTVKIPENLVDDVMQQLLHCPEKLSLFNQGGIHE